LKVPTRSKSVLRAARDSEAKPGPEARAS